MAAKKDNEGAAIERLSPEEIAEFVGKESKDDLTSSGRSMTEVRSETKVVNYTEVTPSAPVMEVEVVEEELAGGTLMRTYMAVEPAKSEED